MYVAVRIFAAFTLALTPVSASIPEQPSAHQLVTTLLSNERNAIAHRQHYIYLSKERSDRTNGHLWTERVVETNTGKVRFLIAEDGHPPTAKQTADERSRLATMLRDPAPFERRELIIKNDETRAQQMLEILPSAFLFDPPTLEGPYLRIAFRPNTSYQPAGFQERVLHAMSGSMLVDKTDLRLHSINARLPQDVSFGYGFLATIRAGSHFATTRAPISNGEWKTSVIETAIYGRAIFFKAISKNENAEHFDFKQVPADLTLTQAVEMVER